MGAVFIGAGANNLRDPGERRASQVAEIGLPNPETMVRLNGGAMLVGGLALATGVFPRAAATGLALSLVPTTYAGHRFWKETDPATRQQQLTHFLKNLAIAGGLVTYVTLSGRDTAHDD
jgi:uncharacterized membrane protein YphA (DoxX/SURF4 family)